MYPPLMVILIRSQKADLCQILSSANVLSSCNPPLPTAYPRSADVVSGIESTDTVSNQPIPTKPPGDAKGENIYDIV